MMGQVVKLDKTADAAHAAEQARLAAANDAIQVPGIHREFDSAKCGDSVD